MISHTALDTVLFGFAGNTTLTDLEVDSLLQAVEWERKEYEPTVTELVEARRRIAELEDMLHLVLYGKRVPKALRAAVEQCLYPS